MRIDRLSNAPDRAGRYYVLLSDGTKLRLYRRTVEDFGLYPGLELSEEDGNRLKAAAGEMSAKMRAVRIVAASNVSKQDLQSRLIRKGETEEDARTAVEWMASHELVDDRTTARQVAESCASKGYGIARAKQALYEKKIPRQYWEEALEGYPDQQEKILTFLRARLDGESDRRDIQRAVAALTRRGHSYASIREGLRQLSLETEELPEDE